MDGANGQIELESVEIEKKIIVNNSELIKNNNKNNIVNVKDSVKNMIVQDNNDDISQNSSIILSGMTLPPLSDILSLPLPPLPITLTSKNSGIIIDTNEINKI